MAILLIVVCIALVAAWILLQLSYRDVAAYKDAVDERNKMLDDFQKDLFEQYDNLATCREHLFERNQIVSAYGKSVDAKYDEMIQIRTETQQLIDGWMEKNASILRH